MINVESGQTVNDVFLQDEEMYVHSSGVANGTIVQPFLASSVIAEIFTAPVELFRI